MIKAHSNSFSFSSGLPKELITPEEALKEIDKNIEALAGHDMPLQALNRKQRRTLLATKVQKKILKKVARRR